MATGSAAQAAQSVALRLRAEPGSQQQGLTWARSDHWPSAISPSPPLAALGLGSVCGFSCSMHGHRRHTCGRGPGFLPERAAGRASLRGPKVGERKRQDRKAGQGAAPRGKPATQPRQGRRLTGLPGPRATDPKLRTRGTPGVQMPHARDVSLLGGVQGPGRPRHRRANSGEAHRCLDLLHSAPEGLGRRGAAVSTHRCRSQLAIRGASHAGLGGGGPGVRGRARGSPRGQNWLRRQAERGRHVPPGGGRAVGRGWGQQAWCSHRPAPWDAGLATPGPAREGTQAWCGGPPHPPRGPGPGAQDPGTRPDGRPPRQWV